MSKKCIEWRRGVGALTRLLSAPDHLITLGIRLGGPVVRVVCVSAAAAAAFARPILLSIVHRLAPPRAQIHGLVAACQLSGGERAVMSHGVARRGNCRPCFILLVCAGCQVDVTGNLAAPT